MLVLCHTEPLRDSVEAAFKNLYDLYLYEYISKDNWVLTMALFFYWAEENSDTGEELINSWIADIRKDHPNPKGR